MFFHAICYWGNIVTTAVWLALVLVVNEGEPRMGYGEEILDPEGSVTIVDVATA